MKVKGVNRVASIRKVSIDGRYEERALCTNDGFMIAFDRRGWVTSTTVSCPIHEVG